MEFSFVKPVSIPKENVEPVEEQKEAVKPKKTRKPKQVTDVKSFTNILVVAHAIAATTLKQPVLQLEEQEAQELSEAICKLLDQYDFTPNPKAAALINLVFVASMIYVPKLFQIRAQNQKTVETREHAENAQEHYSEFGEYEAG